MRCSQGLFSHFLWWPLGHQIHTHLLMQSLQCLNICSNFIALCFAFSIENSSDCSQWMWGTKQQCQLDRHPIHTQFHCSWVTSRSLYRMFVWGETRVQRGWMKDTLQGRAKACSARTKTENGGFVLSLKSKKFSLHPRKKHGLVGRAGSRAGTEVPFLTLLLAVMRLYRWPHFLSLTWGLYLLKWQ